MTSFLSLLSPEALTAGTLYTLLWLLQLVLGRMAAAFHLAGAGSLAAPREHGCWALSDIHSTSIRDVATTQSSVFSLPSGTWVKAGGLSQMLKVIPGWLQGASVQGLSEREIYP